MFFTFSALISNIYWCGIVSHQQILMVQHVAPAEIIGAANAAPAAPVSTPMHAYPQSASRLLWKYQHLSDQSYLANYRIVLSHRQNNFSNFCLLSKIWLSASSLSIELLRSTLPNILKIHLTKCVDLPLEAADPTIYILPHQLFSCGDA